MSPADVPARYDVHLWEPPYACFTHVVAVADALAGTDDRSLERALELCLPGRPPAQSEVRQALTALDLIDSRGLATTELRRFTRGGADRGDTARRLLHAHYPAMTELLKNGSNREALEISLRRSCGGMGPTRLNKSVAFFLALAAQAGYDKSSVKRPRKNTSPKALSSLSSPLASDGIVSTRIDRYAELLLVALNRLLEAEIAKPDVFERFQWVCEHYEEWCRDLETGRNLNPQ